MKGDGKMANEIERELSEKYCPRFAEIAVKKGYVTAEQVKEALSEQLDDNLNNRPHRLVGRILMDKGWMTPVQVDDVMNEMFKTERVA
jgi:hypothetical protein